MRYPLPTKISLGFGFTIKVIQCSPKEYMKAYNAEYVDKMPDSSYAFSTFEVNDKGHPQMKIFLKKHAKYPDKVKNLTHEVGHLFIEWLDQVRTLAERS